MIHPPKPFGQGLAKSTVQSLVQNSVQSEAESPGRWSRRRLIRAAGGTLLAAPALLLSAPRPLAAYGSDPMRRVLCPEDECGYRYNPRIGDPEHGIPAGTPFEELPEDWECPECGTAIRFW